MNPRTTQRLIRTWLLAFLACCLVWLYTLL